MRLHRRLAATFLASAALIIGGATLIVSPSVSANGKADKITICHRTDSNSNPYREITVSENSTDLRGHEDHTGPVWNPTLKAQHIKWGDIIIDSADGDGKDVRSLNDNAAGRAFLANDCNIPVVTTPTPTPTPTGCDEDCQPTPSPSTPSTPLTGADVGQNIPIGFPLLALGAAIAAAGIVMRVWIRRTRG